uniref:ABC transporter domain-containing protein n=1 Tax=Physcomitrium patens TaxID=3218 RepID=A0A7I4B8A9_PHYPA
MQSICGWIPFPHCFESRRQLIVALIELRFWLHTLLGVCRMARYSLHNGGTTAFSCSATAVCISKEVLRTALSNRLAKVQGWLFRAAFLTRAPLFTKLITENLIFCFFQSSFLSTTEYLTGALSLRFRKILTDRIHSDYFQNMTYYKMSHVDHRISSVEQRIASDVPRFSTEMSELVQENLSAVFDGLFYTWRLCSYASPKTLIWHLSKVLHTQLWFGIIQDFVLKYLGSTFAVDLIIEPFFSGSLRPDGSTLGRAQMLSLMRYHTSVIISLFQAMGTLTSNTRKLGRLSGYADRICELMSVSKELRIAGGSATIQNKDTGSCFVEAPYIEFEGVKLLSQVVTPTGNILAENLTLKVEPGSNLLITGPNGSGKSSLFRVLGGLWPLVEGRISKPGMGSALSHEIFYVPQRPYTSVGTLRDQLIYPLTSVEETQSITAEGMRELLRNVDLEYLLDRYPQSQEVIWGDELSLGEQQRLGMARLFYHRPLFAILDECTSAVTTDMEERFCAQVRAMGTSCVTISHRPALVAFHDTVLSLDGEGGWTVNYKSSSVPLPRVELQDDGILEKGDSHTVRQSDALTVQKQFFTNIGQEGSDQETTADDSCVGAVLATSPPRDSIDVVPAISGLQIQPCSMPSRMSSLFKILIRLHSFALWALVFCRVVSQHFSLHPFDMTATLALGWRHRLTTHLSNLYFQNYGFYKAMHLVKSGSNDADQRITQDVEKLSGDLSGLVTGMVKPLIDILWFTCRMKVLTGIRGVGFLYAYMFLGLGFLRVITPDFGALTSKEQQLDGSFRYIHSRLRTHAESIAFFGGGSRQQAVTAGRFKALIAHSQYLLRRRWLFGIADDFITKQLPYNVSWGLSLMYAMEHRGNRALTSVQGELAHDLRFLASVISQSFLAFGDILELYRKFLELSGGVTRVSELNELLIAAQNGQKLLARKLSMRSSAGKSLLVTGPNGSGKSSLFRVLGGLWPAGRGHIAKPSQRLVGNAVSSQTSTGFSQDIFYVPQRPYTALGTLRDQIIYPFTLTDAKLKSQFESQQDYSVDPTTHNPLATGSSVACLEMLDSRLRTSLEDVRLIYLLDREGGWDATANWEDMLSLGEQQRLGMARLFFHHPKFGILDECTNATSVDVEEGLYKKAQSLGISVITISQV